MKTIISILSALLLCGCAATTERHNQAVFELDKRMSPEWLKDNVEIGKTTKDQVLQWFGKPLTRTTTATSGFAGAMMPDEMWTYAVRFSTIERKGLGFSDDKWTRSLVFSFKDGVVSSYNTSSFGH